MFEKFTTFKKADLKVIQMLTGWYFIPRQMRMSGDY